MKRTLLTLLFTGTFFTGIYAQTLLYSNDFETGLNGSTIVGNGIIESSGDAAHGQVFHNDPVGTKAIRTNYLQLPATIFADLKTSGLNALTISFWVNKGNTNIADYYWSPIFSAYGAAPAPNNGAPMMCLQTRGWAQVNADGTWCDFNTAHTESTTWLNNTNWHFYTAVFTPSNLTVYIDGTIQNQWPLTGTASGSSINGLFSVGSVLNYICLGGNQSWNWGDTDAAFLFDKLNIYAGALSAAQISSLIATDNISAPTVASSKSNLTLYDIFKSESIIVNGANLTQDIIITCPTGIEVNPTTISKSSATDVVVNVTYNGTTPNVIGNIVLSSGSVSTSVGITANIVTKTNPGTANLTHQWTFDDGSAKDGFGTADGIIQGAATFTNKSFDTYLGGHLELPGTTIAVNGYSALTTEVWFTSAANQNPGNTMLTYFGDANLGWGMGANYVFSSPANGSNCRTAISTGNTNDPWVTEAGINRSSGRIDDGQIHYLVTVLDATSIKYYVDGLIVGSALVGSNALYAVSTNFAFLCKGGYTGDPTWKGLVHKFSTYNKALNAEEVAYLYVQGAEYNGLTTNVNKTNQGDQKIYLLNDKIVTEFNLDKCSNVTVTVSDIQGKRILTSNQIIDAGNHKNIIDVFLPDGIYVVNIVSDEFSITKKIIK